MKRSLYGVAGVAVIVAAAGFLLLRYGPLAAQESSLQTPPVDIAIKESFDLPAADAKTGAIVAAADAFLDTLDEEQRKAAVYPFNDNTQRSNWSNFPDGPVQRGGVMRGNLSDEQNAALEALLGEVLSEDGVRNVAYQLAAEDMLDSGIGGPNFGSDFYYASFLGEPSTSEPWMFQFGGHHLAINVTVFGPEISFSPMLTGGEPLNITYEEQDIYITETETAAAQAFMDALTAEQKEVAIIGDQPINLLLGPGEFGTVLAPEGIKGSNLTDEQKKLLLDVIEARLNFINDDDFAAKMETVRSEIDDTYFGWWGPVGTLGAAYFRVTAPSLVMEYAPQDMDGDPTDHAHNMYRDPENDYGVAWIGSH
ncbi:DUF3500 domain-containing protein [Chelativorans xinjiangense]|uniref:DUF3500 domain-containing protein n=1 Tax=Chelativorans xinjiangense TaxID=2681485 RepID=UPI00135CE5AB|nr:DUF3500 domain-containing protein [Chelativorans xinjiangense]